MELRHLRYFIAVGEELHFGNAAKRLHMAQPPLSRQIRQLEEELGVALLTRTSRTVALTPEGEAFLKEARGVLDGLEGAIAKVQAMARGEQGSLAIGFMGPAALSSLPEVLRVFQRENSGVQLRLTTAASRDQLAMLRTKRIDLGFVLADGHELDEYASQLFWREPYVLAVPAAHPFARSMRISIADLRDEPMIVYPRHLQPNLFDSLIASFQQAGFSPCIAQESNTAQSTVALVAAGLGCALVPQSTQRNLVEGVCFVEISEPLPPWEITMVWNGEEQGPLLDRFLETVSHYSNVGREP